MLNILKTPIFLIFATIITIVFYISLSKTKQRVSQTSELIAKTEQTNAEIEKRNADLEEKLQNLDKDIIIHDQLLMQKPGEYVVKVPEMPAPQNQPDPTTDQSNLEKWLKVLF